MSADRRSRWFPHCQLARLAWSLSDADAEEGRTSKDDDQQQRRQLDKGSLAIMTLTCSSGVAFGCNGRRRQAQSLRVETRRVRGVMYAVVLSL